MKFQEILYIPIADIICELHFQNKEHKKIFKKKYMFLTVLPKKYTPIKIFLEETSQFYTLSSSSKKKKMQIRKQDLVSLTDIEVLVSLLIEYTCVNKGILFFHGSSFIKNGKGYACSASSGVGKSTIVSKVPKKNILSDDLFVVKKINNEFYIFTSPFDNAKIPNLVFQNAPLDTIFFLKQAIFTKIEEETLGESIYNLLFNNLLLGWNKIQMEQSKRVNKSLERKIHSLVFDLARLCKMRTLHFTKDISFLNELEW